MINISLPDGSVRSFDKPVSGADIAAVDRPRPRQGGACRARRRQDERPLRHVVDRDAKIGIVTSRDPEALELLRHDAAHVLAQAVQELYPGTQITFGPATEDGFYYDFARDEPFSPDDFAKIEQRMARDRRPRPADHARSLGPREDQASTSRSTARASRPSGSTNCPRTRRSRSTSRATGSTCAVGRTCRRRASSARRSS